MILGFTGTQQGMTDLQKKVLYRFVSFLDLDEFHHGDCIGADDQAASIVYELRPLVPIHSHPCIITNKRAFNPHASVTYPPKPPFDRNKIIVEASSHMVAAPKEMQRQNKGGTWHTVKYSIAHKTPLLIIYPDGQIEIHETPKKFTLPV